MQIYLLIHKNTHGFKRKKKRLLTIARVKFYGLVVKQYGMFWTETQVHLIPSCRKEERREGEVNTAREGR